jgi:hypothetical protein
MPENASLKGEEQRRKLDRLMRLTLQRLGRASPMTAMLTRAPFRGHGCFCKNSRCQRSGPHNR